MFLRWFGVPLLAAALAMPAFGQHGHGGSHAGAYHGGAAHGGFHAYHSYNLGGYQPYHYGYGAYRPYSYGYGYGAYRPYVSGYRSYGYGTYYPWGTYSNVYPYAASVPYVAPALPSDYAADLAPSDAAPASARTDNTAMVEVHVPASAEVWFAGEPTQQRGEVRLFTSPPLEPRKAFYYEVKARWMENGRPVERDRKVYVQANERVVVDFMSAR